MQGKRINKNINDKIKCIILYAYTGCLNFNKPIIICACVDANKYSVHSMTMNILFNRSLKFGILFSARKHAYVSTIYKKKLQNEVINYRPTSVLSTISNLFESVPI